MNPEIEITKGDMSREEGFGSIGEDMYVSMEKDFGVIGEGVEFGKWTHSEK